MKIKIDIARKIINKDYKDFIKEGKWIGDYQNQSKDYRFKYNDKIYILQDERKLKDNLLLELKQKEIIYNENSFDNIKHQIIWNKNGELKIIMGYIPDDGYKLIKYYKLEYPNAFFGLDICDSYNINILLDEMYKDFSNIDKQNLTMKNFVLRENRKYLDNDYIYKNDNWDNEVEIFEPKLFYDFISGECNWETTINKILEGNKI